MLVGLEDGDDAAIYQLNDDTAIIHTVDFFTPVVDDPYDFGAIAAANAMSDVYAMGGQVIMALNICTSPSSLPNEVLSEILRGGAETVAEAGGVLAGGHTVEDPEPKYGLAVLGTVHPKNILSKKGALVGDKLFLTKALGTGSITTALKNGAVDPGHLRTAVAGMKTLNMNAAKMIQRITAHACTDITGFALMGHVSDLAEKSGVRFKIESSVLPFLDGARDYAAEGYLPGGTKRNENFFGARISISSDIPVYVRSLLFTPETSGGLLFAAPAQDTSKILAECRSMQIFCVEIGEVVAGSGVEVA
jgi:selenide, water dikinase